MSSDVINVVVHGTGRMAGAVVSAATHREPFRIAAVVGRSRPDWDWFGDWWEHFEDIETRPDLLIDFSLADGTLAAVEWCVENTVPLLSGVTGLDETVMEALNRASGRIPVLWAPNLSLGINLLARLATDTARIAPAGTPVRIEDVHHQWKKDAPSGTALMLARVIEKQLGQGARSVEIESIREGEVVGDHRITFRFGGETIELTHRASDRSIFAQGALDAGAWLIQQPPGYHTAADWLEGMLNPLSMESGFDRI